MYADNSEHSLLVFPLVVYPQGLFQSTA